jgi:uncharacterized protein YndB with AHSA1/START domain
MTIVGVTQDPEARTLTITSEFGVPADRVWRMWSDPRRLERWWGPPTHPVTVLEHDLRPGGTVSYHATGPDGDRRTGWWHVHAVEPPGRLEFDLGDPDIPTVRVRVRIDGIEGGTRMVMEASFPSAEAMDMLILMGFAEGMSTAIGQLDDHL